ncbi:CpaD family pilus assembly protein [Pelagerythrobacter rhizovicinus]|uniref:Pilus assembly protein CpaD n=1 Tax=Pelagerythrobacter rhizovicinus TaxID=2268576 RepID=A0A4Q2KGA9_9SPHN|nr:CpaD family pilus assembly protein [Pelagerythrobacter rhizovicinus]RXZ64084.1 pilus assembly protein CpaD [Pelagerythrobacter rhizovicinus]
MSKAINRKLAGAIALSLGLSLAACGSMPQNRSLYSTKQPVVERTNYVLDVQATAGGLPIPEQQRLADWFQAMDLRYGDRVAVDDPTGNGATREAVATLAARHGILLSDGAPVTAGHVEPGNARVVLTRSSAQVAGCPDWSAKSDMNYTNATSPNYGCAINGNMAAMIANPEDLISGQKGTGETVVMSSSKAINSYREQAPTGEGGLAASDSAGGGN